MKYSRLPLLRAIGAHVPPMLVMTREVYVRNRLRGRCQGGRWQVRIDCGDRWIDDGIVLEQPTHLSYPQVFERDGAWYMIPESGASDETGLYRAADFPRKWEKVASFFNQTE